MKKICVITSSRADYFPSRKLLFDLNKDPDIKLQLIVTGSHLSHEFGLTYKDIIKDRLKISEKVEINLSSDTDIAVSKTMGLSLISFSEVFSRLNPDILLVVGDRYEMFSAATAGHICRIPIAHISGGEVTEGAIDDAFRHSISKMSQFHFTSTEEYKKRVIQLGEKPKNVYCVGEIGLDQINDLELLSKKRLEKEINFKLKGKNLLVTFHPATLEKATSANYFNNLLISLSKQKNTNLIFTFSNADTDGRIINEMILQFVQSHSDRAVCFKSLGSLKYLSLLQYIDGVVGNSSSGIWEVPSFKIGTINIGDRQKGRIKADSVIDCKTDIKSIDLAIAKLYSNKFQKLLKRIENPYEKKDTSLKIIQILKKSNLEHILKKGFYDIEYKLK